LTGNFIHFVFASRRRCRTFRKIRSPCRCWTFLFPTLQLC